MKDSRKDSLAFWGAIGFVGTVSGLIAWICSAPWWIVGLCAIGAPIIVIYALLIIMSNIISNI